jgi:Skp family chaperone for outer membrane proteins
LLFAAASLLWAHQTVRAAEPQAIALVNVDRIFKTHKPLLEKLEPLKAEAKELEQTVQGRQAELDTVISQLRRTPMGTPEHQRLQIQAVKLQNELQQFINTQRQDLQKKEAAVYLSFYRELDGEITKYAKAHGLKLVLRQHETSLDENQPLSEILKAVNRTILYEDALDITDEIIKAIESRTASGKSKGTER